MEALREPAARRGRKPRAATAADTAPPARAARAASPPRDPGGLPTWLAAALLAAFAVASYRYALTLPFISDDYAILDKTQSASFASLWTRQQLLFNWYRPMSRELHYWVMQRLAGTHVVPYHVVSFALWITSFALFVALARRIAGTRVAWFAAAAMASLAAWGASLLWVAGVQELWFIVWALLFLHAFARRRDALAVPAFAAALLSKETAAVLPALAAAWALLVDRDRWRTALRRVAPQLAVGGAWALWHPRLFGRLWGPYVTTFETTHRPSLPVIGAKTALTLVNLEAWPAPEFGAWRPLAAGALGIALLLLFAWLGARAPEPTARDATAPNVAGLGVAWAVLGSLPLFLPSISWQAYYGLFGAFGAWLAIAWALRARPAVMVALIAVLAVIRPLRADTPSWDWASPAFQRRAGFFLDHLRDDLLRRHPTLPPHSRLYFSEVPQNIGFVAGDGPAFRVWYRDSTLFGGFYSDYRRRAPGSPPGEDHFFRYDGDVGWFEVVEGPENVAAARAENPRWEEDHRDLAHLFALGRNWPGAAGELEKLAEVFPRQLEYPLNAGVAWERAGDSTRAAEWYARAAALPDADDEMRARARRLRPYLHSTAPGR